MQTLVLGTSDSQKPFEDVVRNFGEDEMRVLENDGSLRGYYTPALPLDHEIYVRFQELFLKDAGELLRNAQNHKPGITTAELLWRLNQLAPGEEPKCDSP